MRARFWGKRLLLASAEFCLAIPMGILAIVSLSSAWAFLHVAELHKKIEGMLDVTSGQPVHRNGKFRVACTVLGCIATAILFIVLVLFFKLRG